MTFKTIVEVCEASGINFAVMCTANVNTAIKTLHDNGKITSNGTYKDGKYFSMSDTDRNMVDDMAEEIYLSTRFLSLSSDRLHGASKQELKNDLVKGGNNYPHTIPNTINFLQYHSLRSGTPQVFDRDKSRSETAFSQNGDDTEEPKKRISATCRQWLEGDCKLKKKIT